MDKYGIYKKLPIKAWECLICINDGRGYIDILPATFDPERKMFIRDTVCGRVLSYWGSHVITHWIKINKSFYK